MDRAHHPRATPARSLLPGFRAALAASILLAAGRSFAEQTPATEPGTTDGLAVEGELTHVDLGRRSLTVKVRDEGAPFREIEVALADDSRIVSAGRPVPFDQLRSGEVVSIRCAGLGTSKKRSCQVRVRTKSPARVPGS